MADKNSLSTHNSLLDKWTKSDSTSLGSYSLTSSLLSGSKGSKDGDKKTSALSSSLGTSSFSSSLSGSSFLSPKKTSSLLSSGSQLKSKLNLGASSSLLSSSSLLKASSYTTSFSSSLKTERAPTLESGVGRLTLKTKSARGDDGNKLKKYGQDDGQSRKRGETDTRKADKKRGIGETTIVTAKVIKQHTIDRPDYFVKFENEEEYMDVDVPKFIPPDEDLRLAPSIARSLTDVIGIKRGLINCVSGSLISQPNFTDDQDLTRQQLTANIMTVVEYDPEFILKVALYSRKELNIRTTSNFLLAIASSVRPCRQYIKKYFCACIALPSDWIEVAEIFQTMEDNNLKLGSLPAALRKAMITKFPEFDKYQLAKYNKESSGKKKKAKLAKQASRGRGGRGAGRGERGGAGHGGVGRGGHGGTRSGRRNRSDLYQSDSSGSEDEDEDKAVLRQISNVSYDEKESPAELSKQRFTIKQLIRKLHIKEPVEHVMCIIGKKYPTTLEDFYKSRLPGTFEEERAGKRMKLPVPETWETQVSLKGNKAKTWEDLIDHRKLPFMAMLRNLRNLLKAGISSKHHNFVIRRLSDQKSVVNSKQFPFRFFSAYAVLEEMQKEYQKNQQDIIQEAEATAMTSGLIQSPQKGGRGVVKAVNNRGGRGGRGGKDGKTPWWVLKKMKKVAKEGEIKEVPYDENLIKRYTKALDTAVKIATVHNVQPIKGRTILLCDIGSDLDRPCSSAKGLGKPRTIKEISVLMGLMCKYSCEECEFIVYNEYGFKAVELKKGTILDNMEDVLQSSIEESSEMVEGIPYSILTEKLRDRVEVDNLLVFGEDFYPYKDKGRVVANFLKNYRHIVNPNLLFVSVTFSSPKAGFVVNVKPEHDNDIYISGYSDAILRFIAERGDAGMVNHVDKIDEAFKLKPMPRVKIEQQAVSAPISQPEKALRLTAPTPSWRTVRVFISSTFLDMHGERDLLTRFVFPELRALARKHFINVYEVDLRWGVTEEQVKNACTVSLCLTEVSRCQVFIGVLGERYGWTPSCFELPDSADFDWVRNYPAGASLTELEIQLGALSQVNQVKDTAFFFLRDNSFEDNIPKAFQANFKPETDQNKAKMANLKSRIRKSGLEVYDNYPCRWGGCVDGKPLVAGLEEFGARVLNNVFNAVKKIYPDDSEALTEDVHIENLHWALVESNKAEFIGRTTLLMVVSSEIAKTASGIIGLVGKPGCGKTALMSTVIMDIVKSRTSSGAQNIFLNMAGAAPGSTNLAAVIRRLAMQINIRFSLGYTIPEDFKNLAVKFGDLLAEAANMSTSKLYFFLDGLDMMDAAYQPYSLEWLPNPIPENVIIIISALDGEKTHKSLKRLQASQIAVGGLDIWDKSKVVRQTLAKHRKQLDESGFGNQMKLLMLKKDAHNPLYLKLACEELRVFGVFERISEKLKSIPHTTAQMLQEILARLESDHGVDLVSSSLSLLSCVRDGLYPEELYELLNWHKALGTGSFQIQDISNRQLDEKDYIPPMFFSFLCRSIRSFLNPSSEWAPMLSLANAEISTAVHLRYIKGQGSDLEMRLHKVLAGFFMKEADPGKDGNWHSQNSRAFSELPYHLAAGGCFSELSSILCSHQFIQAKCSLGMAAKLLDDFTPHVTGNRVLEKQQMRFLSQKSVEQYKSFVSRNINVLVSYPSLEWQQAMNEPEDTMPYQDAKSLQTKMAGLPPYMEWTNKPDKESQCFQTLSNFKAPATCIAISRNSTLFATGSQDLLVRLYAMDTAKELKFFSGHSDAITDVCFLGDSILCSASVDTTLSLWDVADGHRIHTLQGHNRRVNSCASDAKGKTIVSGGWDCMVIVWKSESGEKICELDIGSPVNAVDFHPSLEQVVVGTWDSLIRIYNYFHKTRIAILRGHSTSVRDIAYSIDGRHLASAALDGDVKLWSAEKGSQVGNIKGHFGPVNKLTFSPSGQELVTAGEDHQINVWSGDLGIPLHCLASENNGAATSVCISPNGFTCAVGYHLGKVRIYDVNTGIRLTEANLCSSAVRAITFSKDGNYILAGTDEAFVQVMESNQGSRVCSLIGHTKPVLCVTTSKKYVASAGEDFTCCLYEDILKLKSSRQSTPLTVLTGHVAPVTACTFSNDEKMIATTSRDADVMIYELYSVLLSDEPKPAQVLHACHADWINSCQWSNSTNFMVTASNDFNIKVWDMKTGTEKLTLSGHTSAVNSVAYKYGCVISGSSDGCVKVWSHKGVLITTLRGHSLRVNSCDVFVKCSGAEETLEQEEEESWAEITDRLESEKEEKPPKSGGSDKINVQDVIVASAGDDGAVWLWRPLEAYSLACLSGHSDRVLGVSVNKDNTVASCSLDCSVKLWKPKLSDKIDLNKHSASVSFIAVSPNEDLFISGSRDGVIKFWRKEDDDDKVFAVKHSFKAHEKAVTCGAFDVSTQSGVRFITCGDDGFIHEWIITDRKQGFFVRPTASKNVNTVMTSIICDVSGEFLISTWDGNLLLLKCSGRNDMSLEHLYLKHYMNEDSPGINHWLTCLKNVDPEGGQNRFLIAGTTDSKMQHYCAITDPKFDLRPKANIWFDLDITDAGIDVVKRDRNYVRCVASHGSDIFAGDSRGQLFIKGSRVKVHQSAITAIEVMGSILVTASQDATIKVWSYSPAEQKEEFYQVGQFFSPSPVTSMKIVNTAGKEDNPSFILAVGDQHGNVHQLRWQPATA